MTNGVDRRAEIDTETFKALLVINGGAAIALLSILTTVLQKPELYSFATTILIAVLILMLGLVCAVLHNYCRRRCSLVHSHHQDPQTGIMSPPKGVLFGVKLSQPRVCWASTMFMWASLVCFMAACILVAVVGIAKIGTSQKQAQSHYSSEAVV